MTSSTTRVGVLHGGSSPERPGSLVSGEAVAEALSADPRYDVTLFDMAGVDVRELADRIDVAYLALHGPGGEDGTLQGCLEYLDVPYTGSGVRASAVGMHKPTFKGLVTAAGLDTPAWLDLPAEQHTDETVEQVSKMLGFPAFCKPAVGGGSLGMSIARDAEELVEALAAAAGNDPYTTWFAEELIEGASCSVGLVEIEGTLTVLPVYQVTTGREFYDYTAKRNPDQREENCPADLPVYVRAEMQRVALAVHHLVGAHGVSRVDMVLSATGRIAVLEINTLPGMSRQGNLATMAEAGGVEYEDLVRHILATAYTRPGE